MTKTETIVIRVTPKMKKDLKALAKKSRRTLPDYFRLVLADVIGESTIDKTGIQRKGWAPRRNSHMGYEGGRYSTIPTTNP